MTGESLGTAWLVFGLLAAEAALLVGVAALIALGVKTTAWRRAIWQGCFVALLALLALETSGSARRITAVASGRVPVEHQATATPHIPTARPSQSEPNEILGDAQKRESGKEATRVPAEQGSPVEALTLPTQGAWAPSPPPVAPVLSAEPRPVTSRGAGSTFTGEQLAAWLVLTWFCFALGFLAMNLLARISFARHCKRCPTISDPAIHERVEALARRMGVRRPIRLFESPRLLGPVATGTLRLAIGLPAKFTCDYTPEQQDVMLAHELAHLVANDPLWSRLADLLVALLWWHPLVWWARRELHAASETAADESSLLVRDGPQVLAECLVALGGRLTRRRPVGSMGVDGAGFRSGLGRRVERLLHLPARPWAPLGRLRGVLASTLAPAALVAAVIFCTAWTVPEPSTYRDRMKTPSWNRSLPLYALLAALVTPDSPAVAADAPKTTPEPRFTNHPVVSPLRVTPTGAETASRLKAKLDSIVLDQITYDAIPLGQVVQSLQKEAAAKDPEKVGVNFLFGQPTEPLIGPPTVDPATGLPVAGASVEPPDLMATMIRIDPPLKKIRLTDALDAIKRVADRPITYTVEGYAVVFSVDVPRIHGASGIAPSQPSPPPQAVQVLTRSFKLDTNTFFASVKKYLSTIDPTSDSVGSQLYNFVFPTFFGVKWNAPESMLLYNPLTGVLFVRASKEDLDIISAAVEMLGGNVQSNSGNGRDGGQSRGGGGGGIGGGAGGGNGGAGGGARGGGGGIGGGKGGGTGGRGGSPSNPMLPHQQ